MYAIITARADMAHQDTGDFFGGGGEEKPTQWIDLQVREEQVVVQVEEPNNEVGQDPAERWHSTHETLIFGSVAAAP